MKKSSGVILIVFFGVAAAFAQTDPTDEPKKKSRLIFACFEKQTHFYIDLRMLPSAFSEILTNTCELEKGQFRSSWVSARQTQFPDSTSPSSVTAKAANEADGLIEWMRRQAIVAYGSVFNMAYPMDQEPCPHSDPYDCAIRR